MNFRNFYLSKKYYDSSQYPYGFSRAGDFTITEARILETYGELYNALGRGEVSDPNDEDKRLIQVINGKRQAESLEEKTWMKYLNLNKRTQIWLNERRAERSELSDEEYDNATDSENTDFEISSDLNI